MTIDPDGNLLVGSFGNDSVLKFNGTTGQSMGVLVTSGAGGLDGTHALAFIPDSTIPAVSGWGMLLLLLCVLIAATLTLNRSCSRSMLSGSNACDRA